VIALLLLAAAIYGVRYVALRVRASVPVTAKGTQATGVGRLMGPGWSLVALNTKGPLRVVDMDDPSVDVENDIALGLQDYDVN